MSGPAARRSLRPPSVESLAVAVFSFFGMMLGSTRIGDNSMFVHLRTGIDMAAGRGIPRIDPYSYTAAGHDWVVQSWLPSLSYGWLERLGGFGWVRAEQGVLMALLAWLIARLARTGSVGRTMIAGGAAIGVGAPFWSARPLLFGLLGFVLTVLVVERKANPWWLVPVVWMWVNSHGSFPLGLAWIAMVVVGAAIDERGLPRAELRYAGTFVAGLLVAAVNPLGPRLLWFPLTVGDKREIFRTVVEWQSPDFQPTRGLLALACLAAAAVVLARARVTWRDALPFAAFAALGLFAMRNLAPLGIVLAPVLGRALVAAAPTATRSASPLNRAIAVVFAALFLVFGVTAARGPGLRTSAYPVEATSWLEDRGYLASGARHVAHQDVVGCYLDLRYGRRARVFIDDRVDMFPVDVSTDYRTLLFGKPGALKVLDRHDVDAVLWADDLALVAILDEADGWTRAYHRDGWSIYLRG